MHKKNDVTCCAFSKEAFFEQVRRGSRAREGSQPNQQTRFLANHLEQQGAQTLIIEDYYIDRHFMEEFSLYYARCFTPLQHHCKRIHVFGKVIDDASVTELMESAASGQVTAVTQTLQESYLGYVVVRPLPSVPVGRTILSHPKDNPDRVFEAVSTSRVHFLGFELSVRGLAFQQQDLAVAACATTAVWSALQRACRTDGARQPTPPAITQAAVRHFIPQGRPFPSSGLTTEQVCEAFRYFEYAPEIFQVGFSPLDFLCTLNVYLRSGIPVVMALQEEEDGHAVTVIGYRRTDPKEVTVGARRISVYNLGYDKVYMHDDRLGPYARATIRLPQLAGNTLGAPQVEDPERDRLELEIPWPDGGIERRTIKLGLVPLYQKLRTSASELLESAGFLLPLVEDGFSEPGNKLGIELFFDRSGTYLKSLYDSNLNPERLAQLQRRVSLSRYVGVVRCYVNDQKVIDVIWDTTDRLRVEHYYEHVLALVGFVEANWHKTKELAELFDVPAC